MEKPQTVLLPAKEVLVPKLDMCEFSPDFPSTLQRKGKGAETWRSGGSRQIQRSRHVSLRKLIGRKSINPAASRWWHHHKMESQNFPAKLRVCVFVCVLLFFLLLFFQPALNKIRKCAHKLLTFQPYRSRAYRFVLRSHLQGFIFHFHLGWCAWFSH